MAIQMKLHCLRCYHDWDSRVVNPVVCPACHSPYWNTPRKKVSATKEPVPEIKVTVPDCQVDYGVPPVRFPSPPIHYDPIIEPVSTIKGLGEPPPPLDIFNIQPDRDMPLPLRTCKLCGHKGYGEYFQNHQCRR